MKTVCSIYKLLQVFNKQSKGEYDRSRQGSRSSSVEREQLEELKTSGQQLSQLESLLNKAEDKNISMYSLMLGS